MRNSMTIAALGAVAMAVLGASPALASKACTYKAMFGDGRTYLAETAVGLRKSAACRRAYRQCQRRLKRDLRRGKLPRGVNGCVPLAAVGNPQLGKPQRTNEHRTKPRPGTTKPPN